MSLSVYRCDDKSLARPLRKQARKHVRDARDFIKIETRAVIKFLFLQGKAPKEIHAILTVTLACFLPGRAKDLSAPLYMLFFVYYLLIYLTMPSVVQDHLGLWSEKWIADDGGKCEWSNLSPCPGIFRYLEGAGGYLFRWHFRNDTASQSMP